MGRVPLKGFLLIYAMMQLGNLMQRKHLQHYAAIANLDEGEI